MKNRMQTLASLAIVSLATLGTVWAVVWPVGDGQASSPASLNIASRETGPLGTDAQSEQQNASKLASQVAGLLEGRRLRNWANVGGETASPAPLSVPAQDSRVRLLGTIVEPGNSFAMVSDNAGNIDLQPEGGVLNIQPTGFRVESIRSNEVVLSFQGRQKTLHLSAASEIPDGKHEAAMGEATGAGQAGTMNVDEESDGTPEFDSLDAELDWLNGNPPSSVGNDGKNSQLNPEPPQLEKSGDAS